MSIYRTKNGRTFAAPTGANAHEIVQAWMREMLHEAMPTMPEEIAEKHGITDEDERANPVTPGMERVLGRVLRQEATQAVVGNVQRLNNEALGAMAPAKGSSAWKSLAERATQQQAEMTASRQGRDTRAQQYLNGLDSKAEKSYALAAGIAIMHGGQVTLPRGKAGQAAADLPKDVKMRLRREIAAAMGHTGQGAAPVEIAETRTDAPQPASLHEAARTGLAPPVEATVGARQAQVAAQAPAAPKPDKAKANDHESRARAYELTGDKEGAALHREAAAAHESGAPGAQDASDKAEAWRGGWNAGASDDPAQPGAGGKHDETWQAGHAHGAAFSAGGSASGKNPHPAGSTLAGAWSRGSREGAGDRAAEQRAAAALPSRPKLVPSPAPEPKASQAQVTPPEAPATPQAAEAAGQAAAGGQGIAPIALKGGQVGIGQATIKQDRHPTTGEATHVVNLGYRLGSDHFYDAAAKARELGGSYVRRVGFSFSDPGKAHDFAQHYARPPAGANQTAQATQTADAAARKAAGVAPRASNLHPSSAVSEIQLKAHGEATEAINAYAAAVDAGASPKELAAKRAAAMRRIDAHAATDKRQGYSGKATIQQHGAALLRQVEGVDGHAHDKGAAAKPGADPEAFARHMESIKGDQHMGADFKNAVDKALSGHAWQVPGGQRAATGEVSLEQAVRAAHDLHGDPGRLSGPVHRAAYALGLPVAPRQGSEADVPHAALQAALQKVNDPKAYTASYEKEKWQGEMKRRQSVAKALGVPVEKVGPQIGTDVTSLSTGLDAIRARLHDHKTRDSAKSELAWRQGLADAAGHKVDLSTLGEGGKKDAAWSGEQVVNGKGERYVRRGDRWHKVEANGAVADWGQHRNEIEGGQTWKGQSVSTADLHNATANEVARSPNAKADLMAALRGHAGHAFGRPIESKGGGALPFDHVVQAMNMVEGRRGRKEEPTPWHEYMSDDQLKAVHAMPGVAGVISAGVQNEMEAREHVGLGAAVQSTPAEVELKNAAGTKVKTAKAETAHGLAVHKTLDDKGWIVTHHGSGQAVTDPTKTKGEAMQALALFRKHYGADLPANAAKVDHAKGVAAQEIVNRHIHSGIAARSVALTGGERTASASHVQANDALRRMATEEVPRAKAPGKEEPKALTPEQARKRLGTFASKEESRPNLNGYYVGAGADHGVATDGHRLATIPVAGHDVQNEGAKEGAIYRHQHPKGHEAAREKYAAQQLASGTSPEAVEKWKAGWDRDTGAGSKVDAAFPDYTQVVRKRGTQAEDHIDPKRLRDVLTHASTLSSTRTHGVILSREGGKVYVGVGGPGNDVAPEHIRVQVGHTDHPDGKLAVHSGYLGEAAKGAKDTLAVGWDSDEPLAPMSLHRTDGEHHTIMPLRM